jgi:prophage regulatory protein
MARTDHCHWGVVLFLAFSSNRRFNSCMTMPDNYLRYRQVIQLINVSYATIWSWVKQGRFPQPIQLQPGRLNSPVVWKETEIQVWLDSRPRGFGLVTPGIKRHRARQVQAQRVAAVNRYAAGGPTKFGFKRGDGR